MKVHQISQQPPVGNNETSATRVSSKLFPEPSTSSNGENIDLVARKQTRHKETHVSILTDLEPREQPVSLARYCHF